MAVIALLLLNPFASIAQTVPGAAWATTTPQEAGWSPDLVARANEYADGIGTATLLVVQHGVIVDSLGTTSNRLELHSVRKSLLSALIGIAVGERRIGLDQTLAQLGIDDVPPPLTAEEKQTTVQDLLESRSGVYHVALYETDGERLNRPARGSHPPGTFWYYNNWDFNALGSIYEHATGQGQGVPDMGLPAGAFWADGAEGQFVVVDPADDLVVVHQTNGTRVRRRDFGHIMWLIREAAHAPNPGLDPAEPRRMR